MEFQDLIKQVSPTLKRITHKLNGRFTFFNEDDLYQEASIFLLENFRQGKLGDKTQSYILQGCYFHLKNYIRKTYKRVPLISLDALVNQDQEPLEANMPYISCQTQIDIVEENLMHEQILASKLSQQEKEVLLLSLQGLTCRQIGSKMSLSHVRVVKIKKSLREKLKNFVS